MEQLKIQIEQVKKQASKHEAEKRDLNGELIVVREEYLEAKAEVDRVGQLLTGAHLQSLFFGV